MTIDVLNKNKSFKDDQRYLSSVERSFSILEALSTNTKGHTLTELSQATDISITSLQRMTKPLEENGYIYRDSRTKKYFQAIKTMDILCNYLESNVLAKTSWAHLVRLRETTGLGVSLSVPKGLSMLYIHRLPNYRGDFENTLPGKTMPIHLSASGRCILDALEEEHLHEVCNQLCFSAITPYTVQNTQELLEKLKAVKMDGFCIIEQEASLGITTIATSVHDSDIPIAGVSIHAPTSEWSSPRLKEEIAPRLFEVTRSLNMS